MMKAIIDLGTNTFNLLVFEVVKGKDERSSELKILLDEELPVFLGKGGLEKGVIAPDAFQRGMDALTKHLAMARALGVEEIKGFGTSALRNAANANDLIAAAAGLGVPIEVVGGEEDAGLILDGVRRAVPLGHRPALIMDIGGGSIEFILATDKALMWKQSFELGVTRLRERIPISEPITVDEELRVAEHLDAHLDPLWSVVERHEPHVLIGSAGSFESIARMIGPEAGEATDPEARCSYFSAERFHALKDRSIRLSREERSAVPGLPAHRVDTIIYAMIAIERVLLAGEIRDMAWSRYALKEGAASRTISAC